MIEIPKLIEACAVRGMTFQVRHGKLDVQAEKAIPKAIRTTLELEEPRIIAYLEGSAAGKPDQPPRHLDATLSENHSPKTLNRPRTPTAVCLELLATPPTRTETVERLVATFRPEIRDAQRQRWTTNVLDGSPVADAGIDYLLAENVGLTAWARDREVRGLKNLGAWAWIETAKEALGRFSRPHAA